MTADADTVIIPCAGDGTRLGLPFPKELLPVAERRTAVDTIFDLLLPYAQRLRVLVVINDNRALTVNHLARYATRIPLAFLVQRADLPDVTGAVLSALDWAGPRSLVLLPDQVLHDPQAATGLVPAALETLADAPFCFLSATETDPTRLGIDGALRLTLGAGGGQRVIAYADKPGDQTTAGFNAVWFGYGFRREAARPALDIIDRSTNGHSVSPEQFAASPLAGCPALDVGPFTDIGTWPGLASRLASAFGDRP